MDLRKLPFVYYGRQWMIVENEFPYDQIAVVHHLLVPHRDFADEMEMDLEEFEEFNELKKLWAHDKAYDWVLVNLPHQRSIPGLFHYHLIRLTSLTKF